MRALLLMLIATAWTASAQDTTDVRPPNFGQSFGGQIVLTNSGFGIGGHVRLALSPVWSLTGETSLGAGKHEREVAFFDRFGRKDVPNKANYMLVLPLRVGLERRMFRNDIEDNFRPFLHASVGPTIGWVHPFFDDENENGILDPDEPTFDAITSIPKGSAELGVGFVLAAGAHFGVSPRLTQGVRLGYRGTRYLNGIQLLERGTRPPRHFFGTPVIQVYFARFF